MTPADFRKIFEAHNNYWDTQRHEMRRLRNAYATRYWHKSIQPEQVTVEVSRAYEYIEGYVSSLFSRNPSVVVKADLRGRGTPAKVQSLCNEFLTRCRAQLEDATRLALIYPCSFLKLSYSESSDPFRRVDTTAVAPWDVLVDLDGNSWETQKFVAHRYYITQDEAKARYGNKRFATKNIVRYLDQGTEANDRNMFKNYNAAKDESTSEIFQFVEIVELYDLTNNRFFIWSPDWKAGDRWLKDGVEVVVGEGEDQHTEKFNDIPFQNANGLPLVPIIPLYYSRMPDLPLRGYSALRRVYDQIQETNIIRTYQAMMVRRAARQWVIVKGIFSDESLSKIAQGNDGEFVEVDLNPGEQLAGSIMAIPHHPVPAELQSYIQQVGDDLSRGSVMAPFTRGEATKATATEITALAAYTSTEVGRLARERDAAIEQMAEVYTSMMRTFLGEDADIILLNGQPETIQETDLDGNFGYFAQDSGATPISDALQKQEFLATVPLLQQLGVAPEQILKELVRLYDLPESLLPEAVQSTDAERPQPSAVGVGGQPTAPPEATIMRSASPENIRSVLP